MQESSWQNVQSPPSYKPLDRDITCDVVIVGGGIAGIISAYLLAKAGLVVVLLEGETMASGATAYTTACITQVPDTDLSDLVMVYGKTIAADIWKAGGQAIDDLEAIITTEQIDGEFMRVSNFLYADSQKDIRHLQKESAALVQLGMDAPIKNDARLGFLNAGYVEIPRQAKFHPLKFCQQLCSSARNYGAQLYEHSEVRSIKHDGKLVNVFTTNNVVRAKHSIVATYKPFNNPKPVAFKKAVYTTYVVEVKTAKAMVEEGIYEDMQNPYHYIRVDHFKDHSRVIVGGQDHRSDVKSSPTKNFARLTGHVEILLRGLPFELVRKWEGPIIETVDGLPFIGRYEKNQYLATGFSGNGMTYAMIAATVLADAIAKRKNPYARLFSLKRPMEIRRLYTKGKDFTEELWGGAIKTMLGK